MLRVAKYSPIVLILFILLGASFLFAGCDQQSPSSSQNATATDPANTAGKSDALPQQGPENTPGERTVANTMSITVYYATNDANYLAPEVHVVPLNNQPGQTAIELLLAGTKNPNLTTVIPAGTKLRSLTVKDHVAYVDFNDTLIKGGNGGSASEILIIGSIVDTLTEFHDIHQVQILVDGKKIDTISGHMDLTEPVGRAEAIIKKP